MKLYSNLKDYLNSLREILISIYGERHRDIISKRMEHFYINFSTHPLFLEQYIDKFPNKVTPKEKEDFEQKIQEYNESIKLWNPWYKMKFKNLLEQIVGPSAEFHLDFFSNSDFSMGRIDVFSSATERLLNSDFAIPELKQSILKDREELTSDLKSAGVDISCLQADTVDNIIYHRDMIRRKCMSMVFQDTTEGKKLLRDFQEEYNYGLNDFDISESFYLDRACSYPISEIDTTIVSIPYTLMQFIESKNMDETLIHEFIHIAEGPKGNIVTEIRVDKMARKIAKELASKNLFFLDNPDEHSEFDSFYTLLFPVTFDFFERYSNILNVCAINDQEDLLPSYFGDSWNLFCERLQEFSACLRACITRDILDKMDVHKYEDYFKAIIDSMDEYYKSHHVDDDMKKVGTGI